MDIAHKEADVFWNKLRGCKTVFCHVTADILEERRAAWRCNKSTLPIFGKALGDRIERSTNRMDGRVVKTFCLNCSHVMTDGAENVITARNEVHRFIGQLKSRSRGFCTVEKSVVESLFHGNVRDWNLFWQELWKHDEVGQVLCQTKRTKTSRLYCAVTCDHLRSEPTPVLTPTLATPFRTPQKDTFGTRIKRERISTGTTPVQRKTGKITPCEPPPQPDFDCDDSDDELNEGGRPRDTIEELRRKLKNEKMKVARLVQANEKLGEELEISMQREAKPFEAKESTGKWNICIVMACILLRTRGIGVDSTRELIVEFIDLFFGIQISPPSRGTINEWDWVSGPLSFVLGAQQMKQVFKDKQYGTSISQDSAAAGRDKCGYGVSVLSLNMPHPTEVDCVLQLVGFVEAAERGRAVDKAGQSDKFKAYCRERGIPVEYWVFSCDHATDVINVGQEAEEKMLVQGCGSHKMSNTVSTCESSLAEKLHGAATKKTDPLAASLKTFTKALDSSATASTTGSGLLARSRAYIEHGSLPKNTVGQTEVGTRFGWRSILSSKVMGQLDKHIKMVDKDELSIPGSDALERLLNDTDYHMDMAVGTLIHVWMLDFFKLTKKGGVKNVLTGKAVFPVISERLRSLKCSGKGEVHFPEWVDHEIVGVTKALKVANDNRAVFRATAAKMVDDGLKTWDRFVDKDADLSKVPLVYLYSVPICTDFLEGYHGTLSWLFRHYGQYMHPTKCSLLTMFLHNKGSLKELGVQYSKVTRADLVEANRFCNTYFRESMVAVQTRYHEAASLPKLEADIRSTPFEEVMELCEEYDIEYTTKKLITGELAQRMYQERRPQRLSEN